MKKKITSVLSLIVALVLILSLTGCGEQKKFIGTWETTIDMSDFLNKSFDEDPEMADYLEVDDFSLVIKMTFNDDGTCRMFADEDQSEEAFEDVKKDLKKGFTEYFEDYIAASGLLLSVDEVLEDTGVDMDSLVEEAFGDDVFSGIMDGFASEGTFEVKNGKLFRSASLDTAIDENVYETYEISDNSLTLLASFGDDSVDAEEMNLYPLIFTKVN